MTHQFFSAALFLFLTLVASARSDGLSPAVAIESKGRQIDTEHAGNAAPFFADFDGDGLRDLLVGESFAGRLRIYRNTGTADNPRFDGYEIFQNGADSGLIPKSVFTPQLLDLNADSRPDIISGSLLGQILQFKQNEDGFFGSAEPIAGPDGVPLRLGYRLVPFAVDWDADHDFDFIAGSRSGFVFLVTNEGTPRHPVYGDPIKMRVGNIELQTPQGITGLAVADWDQDGQHDLLLGLADGSVIWYHNSGTAARPRLDNSRVLVTAPDGPSKRGRNARICVTDWNDDRRLDLVVGDLGEQFVKTLGADAVARRDDARRQQEEVLKKWAVVFRKYRTAMAAFKSLDSAGATANSRRVDLLRKRLRELKSVHDAYGLEEKSYVEGDQFHGRLWLFLRE